MPNVEKHPAGSFCWLELSTPDQTAAKQFYTSLFGWTFEDHPMGPNGVYTMFKLKGRDVGACFGIPPGQPMPTYWALYMCVDDADGTVTRAGELGAKVIKDAFDVFNLGRMAIIQDPTGAIFQIWQPKAHQGIGIAGEDGALCWADLMTPDAQRAKTFYEGLFGWEIVPGKDKPADSYLHIKNGEAFIGGIPPRPNESAPPHWMVYFMVSDCDAATDKVKQLGGQIYMPPMNVETNLRFSVVADPQGAAFALFTGR
jgi:uncharacterized protein